MRRLHGLKSQQTLGAHDGSVVSRHARVAARSHILAFRTRRANKVGATDTLRVACGRGGHCNKLCQRVADARAAADAVRRRRRCRELVLARRVADTQLRAGAVRGVGRRDALKVRCRVAPRVRLAHAVARRCWRDGLKAAVADPCWSTVIHTPVRLKRHGHLACRRNSAITRKARGAHVATRGCFVLV
jgi:hypothetical protein